MRVSLVRELKTAGLLVAGLLVFILASFECKEVVAGPDLPKEYQDADGINGGRLYDTFWAEETGWDQADKNTELFSSNSNFFRCKQCHGWDLLGTKGAYISRAPKNSRPNVSDLNIREIVADLTPEELFAELKRSEDRRGIDADLSDYDPASNATIGDQMPDYGALLTDEQIWDLVRFLKSEAIDTSTLYDAETTGAYPTGSISFSNIGKSGNAANGKAVYSAKCEICHGADGMTLLVDHETYSIGSFMRAKPNEAQHKIKYGQLGSLMGGLVTDTDEIRDLYKALSDPVDFPDP